MKPISILLFLFFAFVSAYPQSEPCKTKRLRKTSSNDEQSYININYFSSVFSNNGDCDFNNITGRGAGEYPKLSGKSVIFESGLLWAGMVKGDTAPRTGGSAYLHGLQPGRILSPGIAEDPSLPKNRIYRVRKDIYPSGPAVDLSEASKIENMDTLSIRTQYEKDWNEWPADEGAPFEDLNGDGVYDPSIDIPGVPGASQTLWFVSNDLDSTLTTRLYGAMPVTGWAVLYLKNIN